MPIIRNPFRRTGGETFTEEPFYAARNSSITGSENGDVQKPQVAGAKPLTIRTNSDRTTTEYKLCEINDSGVFLPPSPTEKENSFWSRSGTSTRSSSHRSVFNETEPFNISRESFDSYRRSFDISARSPVLEASPSQRPRQSLDARHARLPPSSYTLSENQRPMRPALATTQPRPQTEQPSLPRPQAPLPDKHVNPVESQPEERFEDVGLGEDAHAAGKPAVKKKSIFARFSEPSSAHPEGVDANGGIAIGNNNSRPGSSGGIGGMMSGHIFGRRRGHSGQGSELGGLPKRSATPEIKAES